MIDELINKLKNNSNAELSVEEIKILYEIDNTPDDYNIENEFYNYRNKRKKYDDLIKIFDPSQVATSDSKLNENTVVYIGDLYMDDKYKTYNLQYIFGDLHTDFSKQNHLENLEKVIGAIYINNELDNISNIRWLENIDTVYVGERNGIFFRDKNISCIKKYEYGNKEEINEDDLKNDLYISCTIYYDSSLYKTAPLEVRSEPMNTLIFLEQVNFLSVDKIIEYVPKDLFSNSEFVEAALYIREEFFKYASDEIKNDKKFILYCLNVFNIYQYISDNLKKDEDVIIKAINNNLYVAKEIPDEVINSNPKVKSIVDDIISKYFSNKTL